MAGRNTRVLDGICIAAVAGMLAAAWSLLQRPLTLLNALVLAFFAYAVARLIYEFTWNRSSVPTLAMGFLGQRRLAKLVRQYAPNARMIYDLGSGRGGLTRHLARVFPQAHVKGLELGRIPFEQAELARKMLRLENLDYVQGDFMVYDCRVADVVVMYLSGKLTRDVGEKLRRELAPGAVVITTQFELLGAWQPLAAVTAYTPFPLRFFVYKD